MRRRRVAVTGIGVISPAGFTTDDFWSSVHTPPDPGHQTIPDWDVGPWLNDVRKRHLDRFAQLAVAAAAEASRSAGDPGVPSSQKGVVVGTALGGIAAAETQALAQAQSARRVSPFAIPMIMPNSAAAWVSILGGARGPCETVTSACAAGTQAVGRGAELIASGDCDVVLAGGAEAPVTPLVVASFAMMRALSPSGVLRPFDAARDGFFISEAAAFFQLESWDLARSRGSEVFGEILGWANNTDGYSITAPLPSGEGAAECMSAALSRAGVAPDAVTQVNAHGTGTRLNDVAEAQAIAMAFPSGSPPVTSIKGATGHAFGASGALELVSVFLSMKHHQIPPTLGLVRQDSEIALDVVTGTGRKWEPGIAISASFGFGGHNSCVVLSPGAGA